jgi:hypothetical protein
MGVFLVVAGLVPERWAGVMPVRGNRVHGGGEACWSEIAVCMTWQGMVLAWFWHGQHGLGPSKNVLASNCVGESVQRAGGVLERLLG